MTHCCEEFARAQELGTDREGYGACIKLLSGSIYDLGCELQPLRFCPWCGADKRSPDPLVAAAQAVVRFRSYGSWDELKEAIGELADALELTQAKKSS